ncbi:MAG: type II toxin-antitoxin system PemK/MazF family toxin [Ruminococcaceae bacterium]|nr:type II toxin-antitoxin system PemK/MazF family toxin [Oscillospiraceae bacterium]
MSASYQNHTPTASVRRGDIFYADLSPVVGSEQGGLRPVLIIQNDVGNRYSPTVIAAAITSRMGKTKLPTHIDIYADRVGLQKDSVILLEQIRTLDKRRLREKMGHLDDDVMEAVNNAIAVSFGLHEGIREPVREIDKAVIKEPSGTRVLHPPVQEPKPLPATEHVAENNSPAVAKHEAGAEG